MSSETLVVPLVDQLDAFFGQYTAAGQSPGLVYGLVGADGLEHTRGFGTADDQGNAPDADTVFPIASMTKSFVALGALLARDRGLLDLNAPITDFYPQWHGTVGEEPAVAPTLRQLLSMGGGLTEDNSWVDPFLGLSEAELVERIRPGFNYSNHPGSAFEYSNIGFTMAGLAVGKAVGRRVEDWVTDEILRPLGMNSTWFDNRAPEGGALRGGRLLAEHRGRMGGVPSGRVRRHGRGRRHAVDDHRPERLGALPRRGHPTSHGQCGRWRRGRQPGLTARAAAHPSGRHPLPPGATRWHLEVRHGRLRARPLRA